MYKCKTVVDKAFCTLIFYSFIAYVYIAAGEVILTGFSLSSHFYLLKWCVELEMLLCGAYVTCETYFQALIMQMLLHLQQGQTMFSILKTTFYWEQSFGGVTNQSWMQLNSAGNKARKVSAFFFL